MNNQPQRRGTDRGGIAPSDDAILTGMNQRLAREQVPLVEMPMREGDDSKALVDGLRTQGAKLLGITLQELDASNAVTGTADAVVEQSAEAQLRALLVKEISAIPEHERTFGNQVLTPEAVMRAISEPELFLEVFNGFSTGHTVRFSFGYRPDIEQTSLYVRRLDGGQQVPTPAEIRTDRRNFNLNLREVFYPSLVDGSRQTMSGRDSCFDDEENLQFSGTDRVIPPSSYAVSGSFHYPASNGGQNTAVFLKQVLNRAKLKLFCPRIIARKATE